MGTHAVRVSAPDTDRRPNSIERAVMPLNLEPIDGQLALAEPESCNEFYHVLPGHPAFPWLWHISLSLTAMSSAISTLLKQPVEDGSYVGLSCLAFDYVIQVPATRTVDFALRQIVPDSMPLVVHWGKDPAKQSGWAAPLQTWLKNIIWPGFVDFIERENPRFKDPNLKRIVEAIRNAYAHGGILEWPNQRPAATWHGATLDKTFHGKNVHEVFGYSDVVALMLLIVNEGLAA